MPARRRPARAPMQEILVRPARRSDCVDIARLVLMSNDGIAEYIWTPHIVGRGSIIAAGTQRCARDGVPFSYQNCLIAEQGGRVAGALHAVRVPMPLDDDEIVESDPVLRPLAELSTPGSFEIRGLAVYPDFRGRGIARRLIEAAADRVRAWGMSRLSVICFDANEEAMEFYRRHGFRESSRRPLTPHPALRYDSGDSVLLVRPAGAFAADAEAGADAPYAAASAASAPTKSSDCATQPNR